MKSIQPKSAHTDFLEKLGLSSDESAVYLALLQGGAMGVSDIARTTRLYRTNVYAAIEALRAGGLVSITPKGKYKRYGAESPKKLEARFLDLSNRFDEEMSLLTALYDAPESCKPRVKYSEGPTAIRDVYDDVARSLKKGDTFYRYSAAKVGGGDRGHYLSKTYRLLRDQKGLERKVITNVPNKLRRRPRLEREIKTVPPDFDLFEYNVSQVIYGDKMAVLDYNNDTAIVIENPTVARFQQKIFELLFRKL